METERYHHQNLACVQNFFLAENHDRKEQEHVNASCANFHTANTAVGFEVSDALENLALATTASRGVVVDLKSANQKLTATNQNLMYQLAALVKQLSSNPKTATASAKKPAFDQAA